MAKNSLLAARLRFEALLLQPFGDMKIRLAQL